MSLTIGSLFSGIGGLELGLECAGLGPVIWQCEVDPFARSVLAKHWPNATRFVDATQPRDWPHVDLICGGFPCQDVSSAGGRKGLSGARSGLWYTFASIVAKAGPEVVVVENVASGASRWLVPVRHQLHLLGYRTRALGIAASDVGAPHLRRRIFVVAYRDGVGGDTRKGNPRQERARRSIARRSPTHPNRDGQHVFAFDAEVAIASTTAADVHADTTGQSGRRQTGWPGAALPVESASNAREARREGPCPSAHEGWSRSPSEPWRPPVGGLVPLVHGLSGGLAGRRRRERIRALGNAVVPQCAQIVGEVIQQMLAARADVA